jgi:EcsC protein family
MHIEDIDREALVIAKQSLENPGFAARAMDLLGRPIESAVASLPDSASDKIVEISRAALEKAMEGALFTIGNRPGKEAKSTLHKAGAGLSGAIGGFFGLAALAVELPISTGIMLRSIADIARAEGHDLDDPQTKAACLEVFALGGRSEADDATDSAYLSVRYALSAYLKHAGQAFGKEGARSFGGKAVTAFIERIAARYAVQINEKLIAQAVPLLGAAGGAALNLVFIDHFQDMSRAHFTVLRLEKKYGEERIQRLYATL